MSYARPPSARSSTRRCWSASPPKSARRPTLRRGHHPPGLSGLDQALAGHPHAIHYALKANSSLSLVRLLRGLGASADANSGGEIEVALRAGLIPDQIVFTGVGKTGEELDRAVTLGLKAINAESPGELDRIAARARARGTTARVALRVNPDIDARATRTFRRVSRPTSSACPSSRRATSTASTRARQGSSRSACTSTSEPRSPRWIRSADAAERVVSLARSLRDDGIVLEHADIGGGLGISYDGTPVPTAAEYASAVMPVRPGLRCWRCWSSQAALLVGRCRRAADARRRSQDL